MGLVTALGISSLAAAADRNVMLFTLLQVCCSVTFVGVVASNLYVG